MTCAKSGFTTRRKPGVTTEEILYRSDPSSVTCDCDPARSMTKEEARVMFSIALEHLIIVAQKSHIYTYIMYLF